jgi:hypothetical protein
LQRVAVSRYRQELEKKDGKRGARKICEEVEIEYKNETGKSISLNHATIIRHANGGKPMAEFNAEKCLLSKEEEKTILGFMEETANRGFPLSHRRLREHAAAIIGARQGPSFQGVGENWTDRFIFYHSERIKTIWSSSLEGARAQAANPTNNAEWFNLLGEHLSDVDPDCIWGVDETGIQTGMAVKERVIGPKNKSIQHQIRQGNRENITVIVSICADGSTIAPAVIYKGEGFLPSWHQDNPLGAS